MDSPTLPVVAIIGRPNVGKSALFNRLIKKRQALVDATPGVTRDRLYGDLDWRGVRLRLVDTGGLQFAQGDRMGKAIQVQVTKAMEEASLALLVCDGIQGPVPLDSQVVSWARRWGKPILLAVNKVDTSKHSEAAWEFSSLGLGTPYPISSLHGRGIGDLLDAVVERLKKKVSAPPSETGSEDAVTGAPLRVAIVGRPNVGKSSFLNRLLNEERVIVDETPGTTRDPIEATLMYRDKTYCLIDTAGMRARSRLKTKLEAVAKIKAIDVIQRADVCLGMLEGPVGIVLDDLKLLDEVSQAGKPLCLVVNKWDLVSGPADPARAAAAIAKRAPFLRFAPVICTSAKTGLNVLQALERVTKLVEQGSTRITGAEGRRLLTILQEDPRTPVALRHAHFIRLAQVGILPPTFHLLLRSRAGFRDSDLAYLEGVIRREFGFAEIPIRLHLIAMEKRPRGARR
ncbi:MAG: ribosome biogenesis GTPase Der [Candidatus Omnitrophica bacterium]|nr:ribosome biogenesis GTPase Der [Candidatus Omnitrophota bacterium]